MVRIPNDNLRVANLNMNIVGFENGSAITNHGVEFNSYLKYI